jgi:hypothetical protein
LSDAWRSLDAAAYGAIATLLLGVALGAVMVTEGLGSVATSFPGWRCVVIL